MKVYIATAYPNYTEAVTCRQLLKSAGHECTASWIGVAQSGMPADAYTILCAEQCIEDIVCSDALIAIAHPAMRGGWWEAGFAYARDVPVIYVGDSPLFHLLGTRVETMSAAVARLAEVRQTRCIECQALCRPGDVYCDDCERKTLEMGRP